MEQLNLDVVPWVRRNVALHCLILKEFAEANKLDAWVKIEEEAYQYSIGRKSRDQLENYSSDLEKYLQKMLIGEVDDARAYFSRAHKCQSVGPARWKK